MNAFLQWGIGLTIGTVICVVITLIWNKYFD